jgi:biopolymer transport protein ExbD
MAMAVGTRRGLSAEMNVTPMIDVLLVLIIIFLLIPHTSTGEEALVPQPPTNPVKTVQPDRTVVVEVKAAPAGATLAINQQPVRWDDLRSRLFDIYSRRAERVLFVQADKDLDFDPVSQVIDIAHADFPEMKVGLITSKISSGD